MPSHAAPTSHAAFKPRHAAFAFSRAENVFKADTPGEDHVTPSQRRRRRWAWTTPSSQQHTTPAPEGPWYSGSSRIHWPPACRSRRSADTLSRQRPYRQTPQPAQPALPAPPWRPPQNRWWPAAGPRRWRRRGGLGGAGGARGRGGRGRPRRGRLRRGSRAACGGPAARVCARACVCACVPRHARVGVCTGRCPILACADGCSTDWVSAAVTVA